jgi:two-component system LytT family response regulator
MKAYIVEDEPHSAQLLAHLIEKNCPEITVAGVFTDSTLALVAFAQEAPELLFLDIEMPRLNGFDLIDRLAPSTPRLIFTTAYDQYAVRAFKYSALDYLLKPIDVAELKAAVQKAVSQATPALQQLDLLKSARQSGELPERIAVSTLDGLKFIDVKQIIHIQSDGSYSTLYLMNSNKIVLSKNLKDFEELLQPCGFLRIHNSHLINLNQVLRYIRGEGGEVEMSDGSTLPVARSRKEEFLGRIAKV